MIKNFDSSLGTHNGDFGTRPSIVCITTQMLTGHDIVSAAVCLSRNYRDLRHTCFRIGKQELGSVTNDSTIFLIGARKETRHVDKGDERNVESVAESYESSSLVGSFNIKAACEGQRVVSNDSNRASFHTSKGSNDILSHVRLDFKEIAVIDDATNNILHVIGCIGIIGDKSLNFGYKATWRISDLLDGKSRFIVGAWQKVKKSSHGTQSCHIVGKRVVSDS
mmetsp:Transcript_7896/g.14370  ORF Transcript_7896/g.14370 Transcript_7896/m.14370 type:complete len:222 (-) Transcript_7896:566-1231(-)